MSKRSNTQKQFAGTEGELIAHARELDELHHDVGMPIMDAGAPKIMKKLGGFLDPTNTRQTSRRTFLMGTGAAMAGGAALALAVGASPGLAAAATRGESRCTRRCTGRLPSLEPQG